MSRRGSFYSLLSIGALLAAVGTPVAAGAGQTWIEIASSEIRHADAFLASAVEAPGGEIVAVGATHSVPNVKDLWDVWLVKIDRKGDLLWERTLGTDLSEVPRKILATPDGGYLVGGWAWVRQGGGSDAWLMKIDALGEIEWQRAYGMPADDRLGDMALTSDGGIILAATTGYDLGSDDVLVMKLDAHARIAWQRTYGTALIERANAVVEVPGGGFAVAGWSGVEGFIEGFVMMLGPQGGIQWLRTLSGCDPEHLVQALAYDSAGGTLLAAGMLSEGACGLMDGRGWVFQVDLSGDVAWEKGYDTNSADRFESVVPLPDGGFIVAGGSGIGPVNDDAVLVAELGCDGMTRWDHIYYSHPYDMSSTVERGTFRANTVLPLSGGGYLLTGYAELREQSLTTEGLLLKLDHGGRIHGNCVCKRDRALSVRPVWSVVGAGRFDVAPGSAVVTDTDAGILETTGVLRGCSQGVPKCTGQREPLKTNR